MEKENQRKENLELKRNLFMFQKIFNGYSDEELQDGLRRTDAASILNLCIKNLSKYTAIITRPEIIEVYHESLETINEMLNGATDEQYIMNAIYSGLIHVCSDVIHSYGDLMNYYLSISDPILYEANYYFINRNVFQVLLILEKLLNCEVSENIRKKIVAKIKKKISIESITKVITSNIEQGKKFQYKFKPMDFFLNQ
jgi:hypothetical protein